MKIFLDTANIAEIEEGVSWGCVDGITTNPTLISKELVGNTNFKSLVKKILDIVDGPVSLEVTAMKAEGMIEEGKKLKKLGDNVVVKIPTTVEGLKALKVLKSLHIETNATLVFSVNQALMVAKAGATYSSPFVGRLDDISEDGMSLIEDIREVYDNYGLETKIIVASVRHPVHVRDAALIGADVATMPFEVFKKLINHPKTEEGLKRFLDDWQKIDKNKLMF
ncbi:MAG: fructose-6-phosphate aldolase [Candidatus Thermoplasmatota archaeon]|nr:fructose-6-phosphate aldolase [Candidatus Thermoplasmatota archaeon]MCL6003570.1 fructose-6-phosphate aldolase [Candidatus Thermoplasmatota archaeon]